MIVERYRFAELAGVSRPAITQAIRAGRLPTLPDKRLDTTHPDCAYYLESHGFDPALLQMTGELAVVPKVSPSKASSPKASSPKASSPKAPSPKVSPSKGGKAAGLAERRRAALERKGEPADTPMPDYSPNKNTPSATVSDVMSRRKLEMDKLEGQALQIRMKNDEFAGRLIPRAMVIAGVINPIESEFARLLSDGCETIAAQVAPAVRAGDTHEQLVKLVQKLVSSFLRSIKRQLKTAVDEWPGERMVAGGE